MCLHKLVETLEAVLEDVAAGGRAAQRACDDEHVTGTSARTARHALARAKGGHGEEPGRSARGVSPDDRHTRLVQTLVELDHLLDLRIRGRAEADEQSLRLGPHRGEVAQVDRRGLVAEVAEGRPVEAEMDPLGEHVHGRHASSVEDRPLRVLARRQAAPLELPQERELTGCGQLQGSARRRGPSRPRSR